MDFIDEVTKRKCSASSGRYVTMIVDIVDGVYILGYTKHYDKLASSIFEIDGKCGRFYYIPGTIPDMMFSKKDGRYVHAISETERIRHSSILGVGLYPYSFDKKYEAVQNFKLFNNKQEHYDDAAFPIAKYVKRSIGIEFETSLGVIPEDLCFKLGLIPLRDGSISSCEYSTVILRGNEGFNLLLHQLQTLREYTHFNKECSLHIHFGDFPLDRDKIWTLYKLIRYNTGNFLNLSPAYSFQTELYKSNGKSYCKELRNFLDFESMFQYIAGQPFFGSFIQPHPKDRTRDHKWNIDSRYYMCNFVNLLCYNVNKTVEFRFLRPTYNLEKILTWIYILNAFLDYSEKYTNIVGIYEVIDQVYPKDVSDFLKNQMTKLSCLKLNQEHNGDCIGADLVLEDKIFSSDLVI